MEKGDFWTPELLRKLHYFNYQRGGAKLAQQVYDQARDEPKKLYK